MRYQTQEREAWHQGELKMNTWAEEQWQHLEAFKEFVINGLDLLSFLLVTPELVRMASRTLPNIGSAIIGTCSLVFFAIPLVGPVWWVATAWRLILEPVGALVLIFVTIVIAVGTFTVCTVVVWLVQLPGLWMLSRLLDVGGWIAAHAILLGSVTFFLARVVAVGLATHQFALKAASVT
jgi:hypothetical protein